jgi:hypothetical protein
MENVSKEGGNYNFLIFLIIITTNRSTGVANDCVQKEQWDQALDKVEICRQVVSDLNEV